MDLYPVLKHTHMGLAAVSVLGFALRGLAVLACARWPMKAGVRHASVVVDSLLLAAGLGAATTGAAAAVTTTGAAGAGAAAGATPSTGAPGASSKKP